MSNDELVSLRRECGQIMQILRSRIGKLNGTILKVNSILADRESDRGPETEVSDHAVLRFLERYRGLDIDTLRQEIREIADAGEDLSNEYGKGAVGHDNLILVRHRGRAIATVLTREMVDDGGVYLDGE